MLEIRMYLIVLIISCINSLSSCSKKDKTVNPDPTKDTLSFSEFALGADLSYVNQIEDHGGIYKTGSVQTDPFQIFKSSGANVIRLRLWHNPIWIRNEVYHDQNKTLYSGYSDIVRSITRAKSSALAVNLDFHYSDRWADPSNQDVPEAWKNIKSIDVLCDSVYNYTYNVLKSLQLRNLLPEMVQIGNEINPGMLTTDTLTGFPKLNVYDGNWINQGKAINAGIRAVRKIDSETGKTTIIALHIADPKNLDWWFTHIVNDGLVSDFDVIGFSYYHIWHTTVPYANLPSLVSQLKAKFNKDIMVLETAYPFTKNNNDSYNNIYSNQSNITGFPYTIDGQKEFMIDFSQKMMNAGAKGIMYWEPAWISSNMKDLWGTGSAWENCTFFDFTGNLTSGIDYMTYKYSK